MRRLNLFLTFVALSLATTTLWAKPAVADANGKLPCKFSVSATKTVQFSQGNLQAVFAAANTSTCTWKFAENQYDYIGCGANANTAVGNNQVTTAGTVDLFAWVGATSSLPAYGINNASGSSTYGNSATENLKSDWGTLAISNGGNKANSGWRTLTKDEWAYLLVSRTGGKASTVGSTTNVRYGLASISGTRGFILFPDGGTFTTSEYSGGINGTYASFSYISSTQWSVLEAKGCVFLPVAGFRTSGDQNPKVGAYWSSTSKSNTEAYLLYVDDSSVITSHKLWKGYRFSVRLVQDATGGNPTASVNPGPGPVEDLAYTGSAQELVTAGTAVGGTIMYRLGTSGSFTTSIPTATNVDNYTVQYYVDGIGCFSNSDVATVNVTIAKGNLDLSGLTVEGNELTFTGSAQELLTVTGSVSGATIHYSTDGSDFSSPDIPTASAAGNHDVWYQVVPNDAVNYNTPDPVHLVVTIAYPTVSEDASPASVLSALYRDGDPIETSLRVNRTIYADGEYNTICLPFNVTNLATSPLAGYERLKAFKGATVTGAGQDLYIDIFVEDVTAIEAGVPYLITFPAESGDLTSLLFNGIQVTTTSPGSVSANGVTFQGIFGPTHITTYEENTAESRNEDYLFVGSGSQLFWPNDDGSSMPGFRAYFIVDRAAGSPISLAPKGTRARILDAPKTTTDIDELNTSICTKLIENGQLYIIKNGVKYNAQGIIVK